MGTMFQLYLWNESDLQTGVYRLNLRDDGAYLLFIRKKRGSGTIIVSGDFGGG